MTLHESDDRLIGTEQAAAMLGVRVQTVYAYVSRGVLSRVGDGTRHDGSSFTLSQVRALAARRERPRSGTFQLSLDTGITSVDPSGALMFRGHDAVGLAEYAGLEEVAELLWQTADSPWSTDDHTHDVVQRVAAMEDLSMPERVRITCSLLACSPNPTAGGDTHEAHQLLLGAVAALGSPDEGDDLSTRVTHALTDARDPSAAQIVRAALVLLADHELATSSVAARAVAGTGASLGYAVCAGLFAMAGPRHGQASRDAETLLDRARTVGIGPALDEHDSSPPGFGHVVYRDVDPRAEALFTRLSALPHSSVPLADELALAVFRRWQAVPNVDLALAAMVHDLRMPAGAGEVLFTIARIAGLAAHVMEERGQPLRFRPRAVYTGPTG